MSVDGGNRRISRAGGVLVRPQPISDKSYVESVVSFLHDVVPQVQAVTGSQRHEESRERVLWMKFEKADVNECAGEESSVGVVTSLVLVLGYTNGFQMWMIPSSGEAQEVLSLRQGPVRLVRMLKTPTALSDAKDEFAKQRPLFAVCDAASPSLPFSTVNIWSLSTGEQVHSIAFKTEVYDVLCNKRLMVVVLQEKIAAFDALTMKNMFCIMSCYPAPSPNLNPVALGESWLAYADCKLVPSHQSCGGMSADNAQSYAATVINAAKTLTRGLTMFGETVGRWTSSYPHEIVSEHSNQVVPGVVTVVDTHRLGSGEFCVQEDDHDGTGIVAHFPAHAGHPVSFLAFDPSGSLLVTADSLGHNFHVFLIMAHPICASLGAVHHLYTLHRGDTTASVQSMTFTFDSRWIAVSTMRGTTHLFPINPYGGSVNVRTHITTRVVNRNSRFHTSAGLDDMEIISTTTPTGRHSPGSVQSTTGSPNGSPQTHTTLARDGLPYSGVGNNGLTNPRLPPLSHPLVMYPLAQIRTPTGVRCSGTCCGGSTIGITKCNGKAAPDCVGVVTAFAPTRGWLGGSANSTRADLPRQPVVDPLFILDLHGNLTEYTLEPQGMKNALTSLDTPLELIATSRAQWPLARSQNWAEYKGPLPKSHPLVEASSQITSNAKRKPEIAKEERCFITSDESTEHLLVPTHSSDQTSETDDEWLTNIEMETHAAPHRRLWMGPQFSFKTFQPPGSSGGSSMSLNDPKCPSGATITPYRDGHPMDFYTEELDLQSLRLQPVRSDPVPTPGRGSFTGYASPNGGSLPLIIDNGPGSYSEPFSAMMNGTSEDKEGQLVETLADAMNDSSTAPFKVNKKSANVFISQGELMEFNSDSTGGSVNAFASYSSQESNPLFPPNGSPEWS